MKKFISNLIQSLQLIIRLPAQMRNRNNPNPVCLLKINDAEWKPFHIPTARLKFPRFAQIEAGLDFCCGLFDRIKKIISEKIPASFIKTCRFYQLIFGEPMISDGFHAIRGGLSSLLLQREFLWLCRI